jgi:serine/threonine protein kinase
LSKAYSNKALPSGTIIREWRLEDVLGVGGFGIVYKGRGIYFGELVAIKEYFPSAIAERDAEATVVPIGSDVEEVHALGLKKFVEEAKLLWNLSTPTRHPNIVSVRSLFEIHGTAYMVMDFEDGVSLSKLLKEGRRFNERSLWNIIKPIAEGLDRAHRVGVLHRDIKPPNILITEENRPVLIDFGSARFEAAEATSTSVTFHTPPYAAVEQYVKTYDQGPWTDIYALAVVLYECVTGEKPPEVLERLHGGQGTPLAEGHWPGFGKRFLQAIDSGMTIRPTERPQSIREWLALFGKKDVEQAAESDDEPTRFFAHEVTTEEIAPVPPPAPGFDQDSLETGVPSDPSEVQFKGAGQETAATKKKKKGAAPAAAEIPVEPVIAQEVEEEEEAEEAEEAEEEPVAAAPPPKAEKAPPPKKPVAAAPKDGQKPWQKRPVLAGGAALALLGAIAAGTMMFGRGSDNSAGTEPLIDMGDSDDAVSVTDAQSLASAQRLLIDDARKAGAPAAAVNGLAAAGQQIDQQLAGLQPLLNDPAQAATAATRAEEMKRTAIAANVEFAAALLRDAQARAQGVSGPAAAGLNSALADLRTSAEAAAGINDPGQSIGAARDALAKSQTFAAALGAAYTQQAAAKRPTGPLPPPTRVVVSSPTATTPVPAAPAPVAQAPAAASSSTGVSSAKLGQLRSTIASGRSLAANVIRMGGGSGSDTQKANARLARNYDKYLAQLADSARGVKTDREADQLIKQANQTKAYLVFLNKQSSQ